MKDGITINVTITVKGVDTAFTVRHDLDGRSTAATVARRLALMLREGTDKTTINLYWPGRY